MEYREDGLMVDYSGIKRDGMPLQEREMASMDQESRLLRAMTELRPYTPNKTQWRAMSEEQRDRFRLFRERIFLKHQLSPGQFNL
jgi:hypothetical protein